MPGFDFVSAVASEGLVVEAGPDELHLDLQLIASQQVRIVISSVRLGDTGGQTRFSITTHGDLGELRDELLDFPGFRLPGVADILEASLKRPGSMVVHRFVEAQDLPMRTGEQAWL